MNDDNENVIKDLHKQRMNSFRRGEWAQVLDVTTKICELNPEDALATHDACIAYFRHGDRENARSYVQKTCQNFLKEQATTSVENQVRHMMTLMSVGKASPRYMRHYEVMAEILYEEGAFEAARDYFEQLTLMKGKFSRKYIYLLKCNLHLGDYKKAEPLFARMMSEFLGREGHMLVSFRDYISRHNDENEAIDLYLEFLNQGNLFAKEIERIKLTYKENEKENDLNAILRAYARQSHDESEEFRLIEIFISNNPNNARAYVGLSRLLVNTDPNRGMKMMIRALQKDPNIVVHAKETITNYLLTSDESIQENLCKGLLAVLDDKTSHDLILDLSADMPDNKLLTTLKQQWSGNTTEIELESQDIANVTVMLENLSLSDLIKNKMRLEEHIASKMEDTTFFVSDVVGSTRLKDGTNQENVLVTFEAYHKMHDHIVKSEGGFIFIDEGDGKIVRFSRAVDAVRASRQMIKDLHEFNQNQNKLGSNIILRIGIHTGQSLIDDSNKKNYKQVADRVLDVACHLEKYGEPGEVHISKEVMEKAKLSEEEVTFLGWREKSGVNAFKLDVSEQNGSVT